MAASEEYIHIRGLEQYIRDLKAAQQKIPRTVYKAFNKGTKELRAAVKASFAATLPHHGGLNARAAASSFTTRSRFGGGLINVKIRVAARSGKPVDLDALDLGLVRHPTFGHRPSVEQRIEPGCFEKPWALHSEVALRQVDEALGAMFAELHL